MKSCNVDCPICGTRMCVIPQMSSKWNKIVCPKQTCGLSCFVKDIDKLKNRQNVSTEVQLLRQEKKRLWDALSIFHLIVLLNTDDNPLIEASSKIVKVVLEETS